MASGTGNRLNKFLSVIMSDLSSHMELRLFIIEGHAWWVVSAGARDQFGLPCVVAVRALLSADTEGRCL